MNLDLGFAVVAVLVGAYGLVATLLARYSVGAAFSFTMIGAVIGAPPVGCRIIGTMGRRQEQPPGR